jgi:hypothetical protein
MRAKAVCPQSIGCTHSSPAFDGVLAESPQKDRWLETPAKVDDPSVNES